MNWIKTKDKKPEPNIVVLGWFGNFISSKRVMTCYISVQGNWKKPGGDRFYATPSYWCEIIPPEE